MSICLPYLSSTSTDLFLVPHPQPAHYSSPREPSRARSPPWPAAWRGQVLRQCCRQRGVAAVPRSSFTSAALHLDGGLRIGRLVCRVGARRPAVLAAAPDEGALCCLQAAPPPPTTSARRGVARRIEEVEKSRCRSRQALSPGRHGSKALLRRWSSAGPTFEDLERDLQAVLMDQDHHGAGASAEELSMYRSASAPPSVKDARTMLLSASAWPARLRHLGRDGDILSEEEILPHPAYLQYYYNNEHLNPRLPVPMVSKEDWRVALRFQAVSGGVGGRRGRPSRLRAGARCSGVVRSTQGQQGGVSGERYDGQEREEWAHAPAVVGVACAWR